MVIMQPGRGRGWCPGKLVPTGEYKGTAMNFLCSLGPSLSSLGHFLESGSWEPLSPGWLCSPPTYTPAPGVTWSSLHTQLPQSGMPFSIVFLWLTKA